MARFTLPRDLYHGKGSLEELKNLTGKKAIIVVGGGSMKRFGFLQKAEDYLKAAGMEVKLFEGVEPDPSVETVMKGAEVMREFQPDWIVAMGGGSPIDAAKAMWVFYEYPNTTFEEIITKRASSILWPTSTSLRTWPSLTLIWRRPCLPSSPLTPVWTP